MLFQKWIIIDDLNKLTLDYRQYKSVNICWVIKNIEDVLGSKALLAFQKLYTFKIAICIDKPLMTVLTACQLDELATQLLRLFFQPAYYKKGGVPFLIAGNGEDVQNLFVDLQKKCLAQGFSDVQMFKLDKEFFFHFEQDNWYHTLTNTAAHKQLNRLLNFWIEKVVEGKIDQVSLFLNLNGNSDVERTLLQLDKEIDRVMQQSEFLNLIPAVISLHEKEVNLQAKLLKAYSDKESLEKFLNIQKGESKYLLDWYHYEYEILPLWFKQLGHIVKVLTGKRYFKSLFKDNVEKYKK